VKHPMGHISDSGEIDVPLVSLDDLLEAREIRPPDYMKVDVEGAEHDVLKGAIKLLERYHPTLFLDTHQREAHRPTITLLEELGYDFKILDGQSLQVTKELIAYPAEGNKA